MMLPEIMRYNIIFNFEFVMMEHCHTPILSPTRNWSRYLGLQYLMVFLSSCQYVILCSHLIICILPARYHII